MNRLLLLGILLLLASPVKRAEAIPLTDNANKHNLSSTATHGGPHADLSANGGTTEICVFCHTPHGASPQSTLWNRKAPIGPNGDGTFPLYGGGNIVIDDPAVQGLSEYKNDGTVEYPNGASKMCLSCHDGVTAIGEVLTGGTIAMVNEGLFSMVVDLATSHPVSFVYDIPVRDAINTAKGGVPLPYQLPSQGLGYKPPLDGRSRMQCTTCHDPHNDTRNYRVHNLPFWRHDINDATAAYDDVCDACHVAPTTAPGHGL